MALTNAYVLPVNRIGEVFNRIRDGQAPNRFTHQLLKDWGFKSTNDRAFIPLLKELGFLSPEGAPTTRYHEYRDHSRSTGVMTDALKEAYGDIFLIRSSPKPSDKAAIKGKFKSFHNASDNTANLMTKTFLALLDLADLNRTNTSAGLSTDQDDKDGKEQLASTAHDGGGVQARIPISGLHYNIQIHLPATKDTEVYNAIFKSLKEHLLAK